MTARESAIEQKLVKAVSDRDGIAYKFTSPGRRNVPDRLVVLPGCIPFWVEVKRPGKEPTAGQDREAQRLRDRGQFTFLLDHEKVDDLLDYAVRLTNLDGIIKRTIAQLAAEARAQVAAKEPPVGLQERVTLLERVIFENCDPSNMTEEGEAIVKEIAEKLAP